MITVEEILELLDGASVDEFAFELRDGGDFQMTRTMTEQWKLTDNILYSNVIGIYPVSNVICIMIDDDVEDFDDDDLASIGLEPTNRRGASLRRKAKTNRSKSAFIHGNGVHSFDVELVDANEDNRGFEELTESFDSLDEAMFYVDELEAKYIRFTNSGKHVEVVEYVENEDGIFDCLGVVYRTGDERIANKRKAKRIGKNNI